MGKKHSQKWQNCCATHVNRLSLAVIVCRLACAHRALLHSQQLLLFNAVGYAAIIVLSFDCNEGEQASLPKNTLNTQTPAL